MNRIIIGTAGHVDHGKTALTKALTGIDTDRLPMEKTRGITIELGFAPWQINENLTADIIDVPGHEKFVKTMAAGVEAVDMVLLLVAADEGIKPQTREHLDIISLFGIKRGIVVISKADRADAKQIADLKAELKKLIAETSLSGAPIVAVSAHTGRGLSELKAEVCRQAALIDKSNQPSLTRMPVDRVFTVKGFGTVVTGTLWSGRLAVGDTVEIQPTAQTAKIRRLEVNGEAVESCGGNLRVALNLPSLERSQVPRGCWISQPNLLEAVSYADARLNLLATAPTIGQNTRVHIRFGSKEILGRIRYKGEVPKGGTSTDVRIHFETPIFPLVGDTMIIASYSPVRTIGSAVVKRLNPKRGRSQDPMAALWQKTHQLLQDYHTGHPMELGMKQTELKNSVFPQNPPSDFNYHLQYWQDHKLLKRQGQFISLYHFQPQIDKRTQAKMDYVMERLTKNPFSPPDAEELLKDLQPQAAKRILELLKNHGQTVKCGEIIFATSALEQAKAKITAYLKQNQTISLAEVRDLLGTSRKYALPILSRLDSQKITKRQGDVRVLVKNNNP